MVIALKKFPGLESYLIPFASILLSGSKRQHMKFDKLVSAGSRMDWNKSEGDSQWGAWENWSVLELLALNSHPLVSCHWPFRVGTYWYFQTYPSSFHTPPSNACSWYLNLRQTAVSWSGLSCPPLNVILILIWLQWIKTHFQVY